MSPDRSDLQLLQGVIGGDFDAVKAALEVGANVNGSPEQPLAPITAATISNHVVIANFLLEQGADPDRPVSEELPHPIPNVDLIATTEPGERALHIAARGGSVEIVRLLLKQARVDPNATDYRGYTPLMVTCSCPYSCVEVVRVLLAADADPALAQEDGFVPLHLAAANGRVELVDMLYSRAPATLNLRASKGDTPLFWACHSGHDSMVSKLLSLGAMQRAPSDGIDACPLAAAVMKGFLGVVRALINAGGVSGVRSDLVLGQALHLAVSDRQARILQLLLTVDGEEGRSEWANISFGGRNLLHYGAGYCCPAVVSILLEAGGDETARDPDGRIPGDVIGVDIDLEFEPQMDRRKEVAVRRMLQRGPASRARSWAWPADAEADAGGSFDRNTAAAAVLSSPPAVKTPPVISSVRIFRPKEKSSSKFFGRLVGRYCDKD
ncbi:unnamed protein product [Laminaria digitata]